MSAIETILSRKSIPLMEDPKPSKNQLKKIYKAGLRAPDHGGLNPWKFIEVSGDDRLKLGKKFVNVTKKVKKNPSKELLSKVKKAPLRAPLIIITIANIKKDKPIPEIEQILSAGAAAQNMLIAAHSMGYSGIWRTGLISFNKEISKSYGLDDNDIVIGYLYIGTPEKKMTLPIKSNTNDFVINWD